MDKKVTGPASYFHSIIQKYGQPIDRWMQELEKVSGPKHMEMVAYLKKEFGIGHGHANALVGWFRAHQGG